MKVNTARSTTVAKLLKFANKKHLGFFSECFTELLHSIFGQLFWTFVFSFSSHRSVLHYMFLWTDWLNVSVLLFQIWYLVNWIFRSLFPNTQGAVTRFNPYEFLVMLIVFLISELCLQIIAFFYLSINWFKFMYWSIHFTLCLAQSLFIHYFSFTFLACLGKTLLPADSGFTLM